MTEPLTNEELSAEIAVRLFGFKHDSAYGPDYASDHNAAMGLVVPEMRRRGWRFELEDDWWADQVGVRFRSPQAARVEMTWGSVYEEPRVICEAALAVLASTGGDA